MIKQGKLIKSQKSPQPPQRRDEQSISGHMTAVGADDDVSQATDKLKPRDKLPLVKEAQGQM